MRAAAAHFVAVSRLREALQLHVVGPVVVRFCTYAPLASVAGVEVLLTGRLTGGFVRDMTSAPRELPGE